MGRDRRGEDVDETPSASDVVQEEVQQIPVVVRPVLAVQIPVVQVKPKKIGAAGVFSVEENDQAAKGDWKIRSVLLDGTVIEDF